MLHSSVNSCSARPVTQSEIPARDARKAYFSPISPAEVVVCLAGSLTYGHGIRCWSYEGIARRVGRGIIVRYSGIKAQQGV